MSAYVSTIIWRGLRRLRIDSWRVLYVIDEEWEIITVLAVRKRPPYNYEDLRELLGRV